MSTNTNRKSHSGQAASKRSQADAFHRQHLRMVRRNLLAFLKKLGVPMKFQKQFLLLAMMLLFTGCEQTYSGEVAGQVKSITEYGGSCPGWEVELETGSRLNKAIVRSTTKPDLKVDYNYVLVWTATSKLTGCPTYTLRIPWEREHSMVVVPSIPML